MNRLETRDDGRDHGALVVVVVVVVVIVQVLQQRSAGDAEVLQVPLQLGEVEVRVGVSVCTTRQGKTREDKFSHRR